MTTISQTLLHSWRHVRRHPWASLVVITTLALAIGANTAIFTLVYAFLLRPFPFDDAERLVRLRSVATGVGQAGADVSIPDMEDYRTAARTFVDMGLVAERTVDLIEGGAAESIAVPARRPAARRHDDDGRRDDDVGGRRHRVLVAGASGDTHRSDDRAPARLTNGKTDKPKEDPPAMTSWLPADVREAWRSRACAAVGVNRLAAGKGRHCWPRSAVIRRLSTPASGQ